VFKYLVIDTSHNSLLCSSNLVGIGELVEIHAPDDDTPRQAGGKILRKLKDPGHFVVHATYDGHESLGSFYQLGEKCILRILAKNRSGTIRRRFSNDEKAIVNLEKDEDFEEQKVVRAKTGSVRKRKKGS